MLKGLETSGRREPNGSWCLILPHPLSAGGLQSGANFTGAAVPRPASKEGKLELTKALRSQERSRRKYRRGPLWSAEDEGPREVRERTAADHLPKLEGLGQ